MHTRTILKLKDLSVCGQLLASFDGPENIIIKSCLLPICCALFFYLIITYYHLQEYLWRFYDADWKTGLCDKLQSMQRFFGLHPSGELDKETLAVMKRPRCGLSDVEQFGGTIRWKKRTLSYRITGSNLPSSASKIHKVFREAWKLWSSVVPMKFRKRSRKEADIVICFHKGDHEDGTPFDGKGGILAHAFLPGSGIGGDVHFDADEDWSFNSTAAHEFGHALGLPHSSDPGAIMYPSYNFAPNYELQLSFRDVKDVQNLYGEFSSIQKMKHYFTDWTQKGSFPKQTNRE
uniref:Peptidase metallopeptidase domain-containing protein n=1 Tax=Lates calcarifer TaxID=8187 RepID=A0A4W6E346_LATCA